MSGFVALYDTAARIHMNNEPIGFGRQESRPSFLGSWKVCFVVDDVNGPKVNMVRGIDRQDTTIEV